MAELSLKDRLCDLLSKARDFSDALYAFSAIIDDDRMRVKEKNHSLVEKLKEIVDKTLNKKCPPVGVNEKGHHSSNTSQTSAPEQNNERRVTADVRPMVNNNSHVNGHQDEWTSRRSRESMPNSPTSTVSQDSNSAASDQSQKINGQFADKKKNLSPRDSNQREKSDGDRNRDRGGDQNTSSRNNKNQRENSDRNRDRDRDRNRERDRNSYDRSKNENRKENTDYGNVLEKTASAVGTKNGSKTDGTEKTGSANDKTGSGTEKTAAENGRTGSSGQKLIIEVKESERRRSDSSYRFNRNNPSFSNPLKRKSLHEASKAQLDKFRDNTSNDKKRRRSDGECLTSPIRRHQQTSAYYNQQTKQLKVIDFTPNPPSKRKRRRP